MSEGTVLNYSSEYVTASQNFNWVTKHYGCSIRPVTE